MPTIKLTLQYDGTAYAGFQIQPNGVTIQQRVEEALRAATGDPDLKIGAAAGRTDAGVHARGQVVHFRSSSRIPLDRWPFALNRYLPRDIVVAGAEAVPDDFHARYWALSKRYRYTISRTPFPCPLTGRYSLHFSKELDPKLMQEAAALLEGRHDFSAFRSTGGSARTSIRTVTRLAVLTAGPNLHIEIEADGFLYNMVRIIAGTLLEVGNGRRPKADIESALKLGHRSLAGKTLPPHGLCLEQVWYSEMKPAYRAP